MLRFSLLIRVELFVFDPSFNFLHALVLWSTLFTVTFYLFQEIRLLHLLLLYQSFLNIEACYASNRSSESSLQSCLLSTPSTCTARAKAWRQQQARIHLTLFMYRLYGGGLCIHLYMACSRCRTSWQFHGIPQTKLCDSDSINIKTSK